MKICRLIIYLFFIIVISGCGSGIWNGVKPDDTISIELADAMEADYTYLGSDVRDDGSTSYEYIIKDNSIASLEIFLEAVHDIDLSDNRCIFTVYVNLYDGMLYPIFTLCNYDMEDNQSPCNAECNYLYVTWMDDVNPIWHDAYTYTVFKNIIKIDMPDKIYKTTGDAFDWFEELPDLEKMIIYDYETGDTIKEIEKS